MSLSTDNVARTGEEVTVSFHVRLIHELVPQVGAGASWPGPHWEETPRWASTLTAHLAAREDHEKAAAAGQAGVP